MEAAVEEHRRQLDDMLYRQQDALEDYADKYASKLEQLEVPVQQTIGETAYNLAIAFANPYTFILFAYVAAVAVQLIFVTRSALQGRIRSFTRQPARVQVFGWLAALSLSTTWYNMFAYLYFSYNAYIDRIALAGDEIASIPSCDDGLRCALAQATAYGLRISQWLRNSLLFEEAWMHVVQVPHNWFWSVEVCLFAVGVWALFITVQSKRSNVPHLWAYMLLGQSCAISVAQNLFFLALAIRSSPTNNKRTHKSDSDLMPPPTSPAARTKAFQATPSVVSRLLYAIFALVGLALVYRVPSDISSLLLMHAAPFLMTVPLAHSSTLLAGWTKYVRLSAIYGSIAVISAAIRIKTIIDATSSHPERIVSVLFAHPGQLSISFDTVCITLSTIVEFGLAKDWASLLATLLVGPSAALSISLAVRERALELSVGQAARSTATTNGKVATKSASSTPVRRRKSVKASATSNDEGDVSATPTRARKSTSTRRKSVNGTTTDAEETTDGNVSEAPSIVGTPAARAKKSRSRPRKVLDASDVEGALSDLSTPSSPPKKTRSRRKPTETSDSDTGAGASGKPTGRGRGRPRKSAVA